MTFKGKTLGYLTYRCNSQNEIKPVQVRKDFTIYTMYFFREILYLYVRV